MALQFNEGAYGQAYQLVQQNEQEDRDRRLALLQQAVQGIGQGVQGYQQSQQQKIQAERDKKLYDLQLAKAQREIDADKYLDTPFVDSFMSRDSLSQPVAPPSLLDKLQTPGMGEAAMPMGQQPGLEMTGMPMPGSRVSGNPIPMGGMRASPENFRMWQQGKLRPPQVDMSSQALSEPDLSAFGLPQEALRMSPRQMQTLGQSKKLFAEAGQGDYSVIGTDENGQPVFADKSGGIKTTPIPGGGRLTTKSQSTQNIKPPVGYRYTDTGDLEPIPGGPADRKVSDAANKVSTVYELYKTARDGLLTSLEGSVTGPIAGKIPAFTSAQQTAQGGVAAMAPVLKQLFRVAGEGVFTDRDQALLMQMIPTRETLPEARKAQIANIDAIVKAKLGINESDISGGSIPTVTDQASYDSLPSGSQYKDAQGNIRRKK